MGRSLKFKPNKTSPSKEEKISRYNSDTCNINVCSIDAEIIAFIKDWGKFKLFVISDIEFTLRKGCQAIVTFYHKKSNSKLSTSRWLTFVDYIIGNGFHVNI